MCFCTLNCNFESDQEQMDLVEIENDNWNTLQISFKCTNYIFDCCVNSEKVLSCKKYSI